MRSLPQPWRAVYTTFWLECEVKDGGHHQFFWNSEGELNAETLDALNLIGAEPFVRIFDKALEIHARHDYAGEKRGSGNTWEAFTAGYREERMVKLDSDFFTQPTSISAFLATHIRTRSGLHLEPAR